MASPAEWVRQLTFDGVDKEQARSEYLSQLAMLVTALPYKCNLFSEKDKAVECIDKVRMSLNFGPALSRHALTMTGLLKLRAVQDIIRRIKREGLRGSYAETGVWRGGTSVFAAAALQVYGLADRRVHLCDSFKGVPLPRPNSVRPDEVLYRRQWYLQVNEQHVLHNFAMYGVPTENVHPVKGFFVDSMPPLRAELVEKGERLAFLRLDGDIYDSTVDVLYNMYDLVEVGGYILIDDFGWQPARSFGARDAVIDFRRLHDIEDDAHAIHDIDNQGAWFQKARQVVLKRERYAAALNASGSDMKSWLRVPGAPEPLGEAFLALRARWERATNETTSTKPLNWTERPGKAQKLRAKNGAAS